MMSNPTPNSSGNGSDFRSIASQHLLPDFQGSVLTDGDFGFDEKRKVWNQMIDKHPDMIVTPTSVDDVVAAVNFARQRDLLMAIRGGGHSVAGLGTTDGGMVLDLCQLNAVWVDPARKTVKVQGGATWYDVDRATQVFGLACAGGVVSETGVGGLTLNGGLSWMRRKVGMSIDNLISADVVLADGRTVRASESENEDLFWAIRGGGGNFGVVTMFEFKLQEIGPEVMFVACAYHRGELAKVYDFWVDFTADLPDELTTDCMQWSIPEHPMFPPLLHNQPICMLAGMYAGPAEEGAKALQPMREVAKPLMDMSSIYPYRDIQQMFDPHLRKHSLRNYWKSIYVNELTPNLRKRLIEEGWAKPSNRTIISIRHMGGAIERVPVDATAFGDRQGQFLISLDSMWTGAENDEANIQWTKDFFNELSRESGGQVYFNFNYDLEGESDLLSDSYGPNYQRLIEVKTKYDPNNFFRLNANIEPISREG